jgi:hypothetical protein
MGDGDDRIYLNEHQDINRRGKKLVTGAGNDQIKERQMLKGTVKMCSGNDYLYSGEHFSGNINMGSGNDYAETRQNINNTQLNEAEIIEKLTPLI